MKKLQMFAHTSKKRDVCLIQIDKLLLVESDFATDTRRSISYQGNHYVNPWHENGHAKLLHEVGHIYHQDENRKKTAIVGVALAATALPLIWRCHPLIAIPTSLLLVAANYPLEHNISAVSFGTAYLAESQADDFACKYADIKELQDFYAFHVEFDSDALLDTHPASAKRAQKCIKFAVAKITAQEINLLEQQLTEYEQFLTNKEEIDKQLTTQSEIHQNYVQQISSQKWYLDYHTQEIKKSSSPEIILWHQEELQKHNQTYDSLKADSDQAKKTYDKTRKIYQKQQLAQRKKGFNEKVIAGWKAAHSA